MPITHLHSYLVHPGKKVAALKLAPIAGTDVPLAGKLYEMMSEIYNDKNEKDKIKVRFISNKKQNDARDLLVEYAKTPDLPFGRKLAERLQSVTDGTPGIGLLFLIRGIENTSTRTVVSRFPADVGIVAEVKKSGLSVAFLEEVFMKNSKRYKAAVYEDTNLATGYWKGRIVDRQIGQGVMRSVSDYWLVDFLASESFTTPVSGSKRLAQIFDDAVKQATDAGVRDELISTAKLIPNLSGNVVSPESVVKHFSLSTESEKQILSSAKSPDLYAEKFKLDRDAFTSILSFETIELDNGAVLSAPSGQFDEVWTQQLVDESKGLRLYQTKGLPTERKFRKTKP